MTVSRLFRALLGRLRTDPAGVLRLVAGRLRHDPWWLLLKLDVMVPARARSFTYTPMRVVAGWLQRTSLTFSWGLVLAVLAANGLGRRAETLSLLDEAHRARGRARLALGRLATELDEPRLALSVLEGLDGPWVAEVRGQASERIGHLHRAEELYAEALRARRSDTVHQRHTRLVDDLRALDPGFEPATPGATASISPRSGRVAHLLNNALPQKVAGYTLRAHRTLTAQREVGLDPVGITKLGYPWVQGHLDAASVDEVDGIAYHHVRFDRLRDFGTATRVERSIAAFAPLVERLRPAVLHPTTPFDNGQVALGLRDLYDIPVVYEVRGFLEDTWLSRYPADAAATDRYRLHRDTEGRVAAAADHVVTLGQAMAEDLVARGVDRDRITVVPNAVQPDEFRPAGRDEALARRVGVDGAVVLGYVSSLVPYEGVRYLLEAVALLCERGHEVVALLVGDGSDRPTLERHAEELGITPHVRFTGRVPPDDVMAYYELIDVFVVPRTADRVCRYVTPLKPVEAMAMARCLVVADNPALVETVEVGETGFTFEAESSRSLADVAEELVMDPELRRRIGAQARDFVVAERSWMHNAKVYRDLYASLGAC